MLPQFYLYAEGVQSYCDVSYCWPLCTHANTSLTYPQTIPPCRI